MNWVGFNYPRDFKLQGQEEAAIGFLMYPYAETAAGTTDVSICSGAGSCPLSAHPRH